MNTSKHADDKGSSYILDATFTAAYDDKVIQHEEADEFYDPSQETLATRLGVNWRSFDRAPGATAGQEISGIDDPAEMERRLKENPMLQQKMKPRHLQMIAVGGSIGTGLFVGSGQALRVGGPAGVLMAWIVMGIMLVNVCQSLAELSIMYPVSGGFYTLAVRFLDPSWGFALGWNYTLQWAVVLPLEITAAGLTVQYWTDAVPIAVWITVFWLLIVGVNVFGTLGYAEEEFLSSCLKLAVILIFVFASIVFNCGGGPSDGLFSTYVGGRYWHDPGAFANGFKGVCSVFVTAAFSFAGTELIGLAAAETPNPRKTMPAAVKGTIWRVSLIYIISLTMIGLLVPWNDPRLLGGSGAAASPFVIVWDLAGVKGLNHLVNATICVSVLSIGLSCVFAGSRTLLALAETGYAPKCFKRVDRAGRPNWAVVAILAFGPIAYMNVRASGFTVFTWLLSLGGLSTLFGWGSICLCHIRFRAAWKAQGHSVEELPFKALGGIYGSWCGIFLVIVVFIAQFYIALWPVGGMSSDPATVAESFFQVFLAVPVVLGLTIGGYLWKRKRPLPVTEIDLDTGRKSWLTVDQMREYRTERAQAPLYVKTYRFLFSN